MIEIEARLGELKSLGLGRRVRMVSGPQGPHVVLDGKPVLLLGSDNYLGLADHPRVREAAAEAAMRWGVGAGAARPVSGTMTVHRRLEERLAAFMHRESALVFGSGFLANAGVIAALARPGDIVFSDELNHASLIDVEHLAWGLGQAQGRGALIVSEAVFSMDGDVAPLEDIVELAERHRVRLLIDESHAIGALGPDGRGLLAELGLEDHVDVILGTLEKSLGSYGAFAACDRTMTQYLLNAARTLIFSTAPSPPAIAGAAAALALLEERPRLVARLQLNAAALCEGLEQEGFGLNGSSTHIMSVVVGDPALTLRVCEAALSRGLFAQALVPPAVPDLGSRLRLTVMASHHAEELQAAARVLGKAAREVGFDPHSTVVPEPYLEIEAEEFEEMEPEVEPAGLFDYERIGRAA